jgi:hypothetical protein
MLRSCINLAMNILILGEPSVFQQVKTEIYGDDQIQMFSGEGLSPVVFWVSDEPPKEHATVWVRNASGLSAQEELINGAEQCRMHECNIVAIMGVQPRHFDPSYYVVDAVGVSKSFMSEVEIAKYLMDHVAEYALAEK